MPKHPLLPIFGCIVWLAFTACNTSDRLPNRLFHNLTARYNPYFLVNKRLDSLETNLYESRKENYNRVLDILPATDTNAWKPYDEMLNKAIKQASIVKNRHENSKWLDASYLQVGKARFYLRNFEDAISTFKYVNTKSIQNHLRQQALVELMRTYIHLQDMKSAGTVLSALHKEDMEKPEKREFLLMRGHFFRKQNDYLEAGKSLGSALKIMKRGEKKARTHFIQGQIYQKLEKPALAYKQYRQTLRNNPDFELAFYAKLYMAQVSGLAVDGDSKKVYKYYKKLLRDSKNKDYQDKIYYEMAIFAVSQKDIKSALGYLRESVDVSKNPTQKGYSFLKMGEINYQLQKFELAKQYYDSTVASLPKDVENYKEIERRQKILAELVEHLTKYRMEDSLQRLAKMPDTIRLAYLRKTLTEQETIRFRTEDSLKRIAEAKKKINDQKGTLDENAPKDAAGGLWYFYNPSAVAKGQIEFAKIWGRRPYEDNWRRSNKPTTASDKTPEAYKVLSPEEIQRQAIQQSVTEKITALQEKLPKTPEDIEKSNAIIENSAHQVGKIYYLKLKENNSSAFYLRELLKRFAKSKHEPEALYLLYQIFKDSSDKSVAGTYKDELLARYPNSTFAKLLINPNYLKELAAGEKEVSAGYAKAYKDYEALRYNDALAEVIRIQQKYPQNLIEDKLQYLRTLINFKLSQDNKSFKQDLINFEKKFPDSPIMELVKPLLTKL